MASQIKMFRHFDMRYHRLDRTRYFESRSIPLYCIRTLHYIYFYLLANLLQQNVRINLKQNIIITTERNVSRSRKLIYRSGNNVTVKLIL